MKFKVTIDLGQTDGPHQSDRAVQEALEKVLEEAIDDTALYAQDSENDDESEYAITVEDVEVIDDEGWDKIKFPTIDA